MIRLAISKNYDTVLTSFELKGSIFQKKGKKYNNLVDGFIPSKINKLRKNQILLITGSIYLLGEILEIVKKKKKLTGTNFQDLL